jgi:NAD(P)-dependent dehydrogenase (short-subunit alcohol dehydrogenase family)
MQIKDSVFIVTGGASGLGAATVKMIADQGGKVVLADVQVDIGTAQARQFDGRFIHCDVTSEKDVRAVVAAALCMGTIRGVINCAGVAPAEKTLGRDGVHRLDLFQRTIDINLVGTFNMCRVAAEVMSQSVPNEDGERAVLILTASIAAFDGQIGQAAYAASKAGIVGMTLPMARDLARFGIRVMTIAPGIFETPMLLSMPQDVQSALGNQVPFPNRAGRPSEYAQLVRAIIENPMLNGETIRLDGAIRMPAR